MGQPGNRVIVADESRNKELVRTGWVRVTNYDGDRREGYQGKRGVYQSTVGGMNKFKQGVIQTVNDTWQGVDALNGTSLSGETAGVHPGRRLGAKSFIWRHRQAYLPSAVDVPPCRYSTVRESDRRDALTMSTDPVLASGRIKIDVMGDHPMRISSS